MYNEKRRIQFIGKFADAVFDLLWKYVAPDCPKDYKTVVVCAIEHMDLEGQITS